MAGVVQRLKLSRFFSGSGPHPSPIQLTRRNIYILPSRAGLMLALVLFAMLLAAINYNNSLAYALTFLLTSLSVVSMLHSQRNLSRLAFRTGEAAPVFVGDNIHFPLLLHNPDSHPRSAIKLAWPKQPPQHTLDLSADQQHWITLSQRAIRRGWQPMGRITVYSRYPLGLFHAWGHLHFQQDCLIYPRPSGERPLPTDELNFTGAEGDRGRGADDFVGLRPYHPGDSLRHLNWKALARERGLLTKQFGGDRADELLLRWDQLPQLDTEARLSQLCRWVLEAERRGLHYGLQLPNQQIPPGSGAAHQQDCLKALALHGLDR